MSSDNKNYSELKLSAAPEQKEKKPICFTTGSNTVLNAAHSKIVLKHLEKIKLAAIKFGNH